MTTETLERLNSFQASDFQSWLESHLLNQYNPDPNIRYSACDFRHIGINRGESHLDDLEMLFDKLSSESQTRFKEGVNILVRVVRPESFPYETMRDLLMLIAIMKVIDALSAFDEIADGEWGSRHGALIYDCASVLLTLGRKDADHWFYRKAVANAPRNSEIRIKAAQRIRQLRNF